LGINKKLDFFFLLLLFLLVVLVVCWKLLYLFIYKTVFAVFSEDRSTELDWKVLRGGTLLSSFKSQGLLCGCWLESLVTSRFLVNGVVGIHNYKQELLFSPLIRGWNNDRLRERSSSNSMVGVAVYQVRLVLSS